MSRRRWVGPRTVVLVVAVVALLSFAVGVASIVGRQTGVLGQLTGASGGVLAPYVPETVRQAAGFTGAMTGFLLLSGAFGLRHGLRVAWYLTTVLLPVTAAQGLVQGSAVSLPLVVLSLVAMALVVLNRGRFTQEWSLSTSQLAALATLVGAQFYGTVGTYALREEFPSVETVLDAFYFTLVTASTVGYGDISAATQTGRLFSMSVLLVGVASFGLVAGTILGPAIEARFAAALGQTTDAQFSMFEDHIVVLGYGDLTEPIIEELIETDTSFIVITPEAERAASLRSRDVDVLTAEPSDEDPLHDAGIERAAGVVAATNNDAQDALSILTARELNPDVRIVAAATARENSRKLRRAGATTVISPAVIGGHLLVQSALGQSGVEGIEDRLLGVTGDRVEDVAENVGEPADADTPGNSGSEDVQ